MALRKREKVLAGATGAILAAFAGVFLLGDGGDSLSDLRTRQETLKADVTRLTAEARPGKKASQQLDRWRKRALPEDYTVAGREYKEWLSKLAVEQLGPVNITRLAKRSRGSVGTVLPFKIEGEGTWEELIRFFFEFESAGYLHKVEQWTAKPIKGSRDLDLMITVEALCLDGAEAKDTLPVGQPSRLELAKLEEYLQPIIRRKLEEDQEDPEKHRFDETGGLFASYAPPRPPAPAPSPDTPQPPKFDASEHTYVDAIHEVNGRPEVWLFVRTEGKTLVLKEGDPFEVGLMSGTIARIRIDELDVEIEVDGQHQLVAFGSNLHQGKEVPQ